MEKQSFYRVIIWKVVAILITYHLSLVAATAQTFTQRIQKDNTGKASVTIHQSDSITQLVNNAALGPGNSQHPTTTTQHPTAGNQQSAANSQRPAANGQQSAAQASTGQTSETEPTAVDTSKKIMRSGYKVTGYRVQAFAGGNSRKDRQQAERTGNNIKASFPDMPVYVHFYSPRWICRVGNFRTYEEAHQMLLSLRKLGYNQATIVKGKITVAY